MATIDRDLARDVVARRRAAGAEAFERLGRGAPARSALSVREGVEGCAGSRS